jgi:hypothetical protein
MTTTYFLSYARADERQALRLADDLIAAGVSVWVDQYDIRPSQHWDRAVETAVRACAGMIVILSPRSAASPNVADEVSVAIDDGKALIPVLIEACVLPLRMTRMQFIDASRDYEAALKRCLAAIQGGRPVAPAREIEAPEIETPAPLPAEVLRDAERRLTGIMGPIAGVLVRQAAVQAQDEAALYEALARGIPNPLDRESFLGWIGESRTPGKVVTARAPPPVLPAAPSAISDADLQAITRALTQHLGPIAARMVSREKAAATSREDLCARLAARITGERERDAFLRAATAS